MFVAPRNTRELMIAKIWHAVLKNPRIGIQDDFFKLGGDSIQSIEVSARLQRAGISVRVKDLFTYRTIQKLAENLNQSKPIFAEQGLLTGRFDLLPIQKWFFAKDIKYPNHWNQSFLVHVPKLSIEGLRHILLKLVEHHDVLRLRFQDGQQVYTDCMDIPDIKLASDFKQCTAWQSHFDLEEGPLWQMGYVEGGYLFFAAHHLIIDTVSWRILMDDLKCLYEGGLLGQKSSSYRQWVKAMGNYTHQHPDEATYWQVHTNPARNLAAKAYWSECRIDAQTTQQLLAHANHAYHTEINDLLLTALAYMLRDWTHRAVNSITMEGHGREVIDETIDVSRTMGWFTIQYPVTLEVKESMRESILYIKEGLRLIPNKGIGFSVFNENGLLPDITFNYLGRFDSSSEEWRLASEWSGQNVHPDNTKPHLLNLNGLVFENELQFNISTYTSEQDAQLIATVFQAHLKAIIEHCIRQTKTYYTPSDFKTVQLSRVLLDTLQERDPNIEAIYPANSLQQGFVYHALSQPDDDAYRVQLLLDYHSTMNVEMYKKAWELAIQTYPILRTYFNWDEGIVQIISKQGHLNWIESKTCDMKALQEQDRAQAFDLQQATLLRLYFVQHHASHYTLLKSEHHSIADGWSNSILLNQVHHYYAMLCAGQQPVIVADTVYLQVQSYIATHKARAIEYWKTVLQGVEAANNLNVLLSETLDFDLVRTVVTPCEEMIRIERGECHALNQLMSQEGITLHALIQFTWHKLIHTYTRDECTIVGTTVSGRAIPVTGIENSVGLYINTLPLIIDWAPRSVREQLRLIEARAAELNEYSFVDLARLQRNGRRLFHSLLVFENYPTESIESTDASLEICFRGAIEKIDYPFGLLAYETDDGLILKLKYDGAYLTRVKAQRLLAQLAIIMAQLPEKIEQPHSTISLLTPQEHQQIIYDWNKTEKEYPRDKTIHQLFEEQVKKTPNSIAVVFEDQQLTYKELNATANQLARFIRKQNPGELVAICMERSLEMMVAILGILKAGCAYVPIDPHYPQERIDYILQDTNASLVLDNDLKDKPYQHESKQNLTPMSRPNDLAYVIYTSGTTGMPKGVMIEHQSVSNLIYNQRKFFNVCSQSRILQYAQLIFDASISELFSALFTGAALVIIDNVSRLDAALLIDFLEAQKITVATLPPALLKTLEYRALPLLQTLVVAGEACDKALMVQWSNNRRLINAYGPTEGTVCAAMHEYGRNDLSSNIGCSLNNTTRYVLDDNLCPLPTGVIGELYIGGVGLARGYLNQPELTRERFIENPFAPGRLYKTGDLARWLPDGNLEYIGRNDFQVKIRGYRIELGEVEQALLSCAGVKQAVVIVRDSRLIAYYIGETGVDLGHKLPQYMIPSAFIQVASFPLTISGKLDRKALPQPDYINSQSIYIAPRNALEVTISKVWQDILGIQLIGIHDDFFHLGGDSIQSIQASSHLQQEGVDCRVRDIFEHRCIERLAYALSNAQHETRVVDAEQGVLVGEFELLPIQSWFFEQAFLEPNHWNQSFLVQVPALSFERLEAILAILIERHDILRVRFKLYLTGEIRQIYQVAPDKTALKLLDVSLLNAAEIENTFSAWQSEFNVYEGPLWQMGYAYGYADGSARLYFAFHHLIIDTVSWRILRDDVKRLYAGETLTQKTSSYRQWVNTMIAYALANQEEEIYWQDQLIHCPDYSACSTCMDLNDEFIIFDKQMTQQLLEVAGSAYHTEVNDLLLTALAYTLKDWQGGPVHVISLEGHGREEIDESIDVSGTVGWFTSQFPVKLEIKDNIAVTIKHIKESLRYIPHKGIGYGALTYYGNKNLGQESLFSLIQFNYLGVLSRHHESWSFSSESSGLSVHSDNMNHLPMIMINGYVAEAQLRFNVSLRLDKTASLKFSTDFCSNLKMITLHCVNKVNHQQLVYTASDLFKFTPYEIICKEQCELPVFMFPSAGGGAEVYYNNVVNTLKDKQKMVLFNNYHNDLRLQFGAGAVWGETYEEIAAYYVRHLKRVQRSGPYVLFGWSFGGTLAFEVMRQLTAVGEHVSKIILIDSFFDYKTVVDKLSVNIREDDINYRYQPIPVQLTKTKIILFKATLMDPAGDGEKSDIMDLFNYYTQTLDNGLSGICQADIEVISMDATHSNWHLNPLVVYKALR
ncbi:MAG: amino acid adenylation domain-containing protein [Legionellaceae bacterium]|nr:amino acid adenylation domain-containing protein [Legionellaceae bacterium]